MKLLLFSFLNFLVIFPTYSQLGLNGSYYKGINFDKLAFSRVDSAVNFSWSDKSPNPSLPFSGYSVRWVGKILAPATGTYRIFATVDDGLRIWIDGKLILDSWQLNDSRHLVSNITLTINRYYDLRIDYYNEILGGEIRLFWQRPDKPFILYSKHIPPGELITSKYFAQNKKMIVTYQPRSTDTITAANKKVVANSIKKSDSNSSKSTLLPIDSASKRIAIKSAEESNITLDLEQFSPGNTIVLSDIKFQQSSYVLLPSSYPILDKLILLFKKNKNWHIYVKGHTDNVGNERLNQTLSEYRSRVVANYFINNGIDDKRIKYFGYGSSKPITDNSSESNRIANRRVEITIE